MKTTAFDEVDDAHKEQLLNHEILDALKNFIGSEPFGQYLSEYLINTARNLERIELAIAAGDESRVRYLAHRLKGSSGNIGALKLAWHCVLLEARTEEEYTGEQLKSQLAELVEVFEDTREGIQSYIDELAVTQHNVA